MAAGDLKERFAQSDIRSRFATDAEEIYGLDATDQLLHKSAHAKGHYVHKKITQVTALPFGEMADTND